MPDKWEHIIHTDVFRLTEILPWQITPSPSLLAKQRWGQDKSDTLYIHEKTGAGKNSFCSVKQLIWIGSDSILKCLLWGAYAVCMLAVIAPWIQRLPLFKVWYPTQELMSLVLCVYTLGGQFNDECVYTCKICFICLKNPWNRFWVTPVPLPR